MTWWTRLKPKLGWLIGDAPLELSFGRKTAPAQHLTGRDAPEDHTERVTRLFEMTRNGQLAAAELELFDWRQSEELPPAGQVLLASLLARRGEAAMALEALDDRSLAAGVVQMRITLNIALGNKDIARQLARLLYHEHGQNPHITLWLQSIHAPGYELLPPVSQTEVEQLACELYVQPRIIRSLVIAQKMRSDMKRVQLLRSALERLWADVTDLRVQLTICEAVAELNLLMGDREEAARWAHRGLKIEPYFAPLALVLSQTEDTVAFGPRTSEVLEGTLAKHPDYRDIRAALIRRRVHDGQHDQARAQLDQWKAEEPMHPVVQTLEAELAA